MLKVVQHVTPPQKNTEMFRISVGMQRDLLRFCQRRGHAKSSKLPLEPLPSAAAKYCQPSHQRRSASANKRSCQSELQLLNCELEGWWALRKERHCLHVHQSLSIPLKVRCKELDLHSLFPSPFLLLPYTLQIALVQIQTIFPMQKREKKISFLKISPKRKQNQCSNQSKVLTLRRKTGRSSVKPANSYSRLSFPRHFYTEGAQKAWMGWRRKKEKTQE